MAKADIRALVRAARAARSATERSAAAAALARACVEVLPASPGRLSCYLSTPTEPGTDSLIAAARAAGHAIRVPRIRGRDLDWVALEADSELARGPLGIREPVGAALDPAELALLDVMLVPGLAVDRAGHRLGQGGGYYDRTLAAVPTHADGGPLVVVVLFDDEIRDDVPVEPHDCRVDAALTPAGLVRFP
jgi:5-formyltetrahydrofolate cyclo-ligase